MPKTYGTVTTFTAGSVLTAAQLNTAGTAINNLVVPAACRVTRTTQQTVATGSLVALNFTGTAAYDTDSMVGATTTYVTVNTPGLYIVTAAVGWGAIVAGARTLYFRVNPTLTGSGDSTVVSGGTGIGGSLFNGAGSVSNETTVTASAIYNFAAGDKVVAAIFQSSGGNLNTDNAAGTHLAMTWIGRTS